MTRPETVVTEVNMKELEELLERAKVAPLNEEDYTKLKRVVETLGYLTNLLENRKTTIQRLRQLLFGASTEKTRDILKDLSVPAEHAKNSQEQAAASGGGRPQDKKKPDGHGRNGADSYVGATKIKVRHETLKPGACCPECKKGKVYASVDPLYLVRIVGQAPLGATVFEIQQLRCNLCLKIFTAKEPEGVGKEKYDETSGSMIALLKYGSGVPFNRIEKLQRIMGIPLPTSTQWDIIREVGNVVEPAFQELIRQAAQGTVLHNPQKCANRALLSSGELDIFVNFA
jgi:transposase